MARQEIDLTTPQPGGRQGEPTASAWGKVNDMTEELYAGMDSSSQLSGTNMLISCGIPVNQSNFAGGAIAQGSYGYDMWRAGTGGANVTISPISGIFNHVSGRIEQVIESPLLAWGNPITVSVEDPSVDIVVTLGGSVGTITAGGGRRGVTITPSGSGSLVAQFSANGATYSRPKVERGSFITPFVPINFATDLLMVQRYFEVGSIYLFGCVSAVGGCIGVQCDFKSEKRVTPGITFPTPSSTSNIGEVIPIADKRSLSIRGIPVNINQNFSYIGTYVADVRL